MTCYVFYSSRRKVEHYQQNNPDMLFRKKQILQQQASSEYFGIIIYEVNDSPHLGNLVRPIWVHKR